MPCIRFPKLQPATRFASWMDGNFGCWLNIAAKQVLAVQTIMQMKRWRYRVGSARWCAMCVGHRSSPARQGCFCSGGKIRRLIANAKGKREKWRTMREARNGGAPYPARCLFLSLRTPCALSANPPGPRAPTSRAKRFV